MEGLNFDNIVNAMAEHPNIANAILLLVCIILSYLILIKFLNIWKEKEDKKNDHLSESIDELRKSNENLFNISITSTKEQADKFISLQKEQSDKFISLQKEQSEYMSALIDKNTKNRDDMMNMIKEQVYVMKDLTDCNKKVLAEVKKV